MAGTLIIGAPGSGKSYFSTYTIWKAYQKQWKKVNPLFQWWYYYFPKKIKRPYRVTYTNINEFDFDRFKQVKPFDWDVFYSKITKLHHLKHVEKLNDNELLPHVKEAGLFHVLLVIDECEDFISDNVDSVVHWFFRYHRHIYCDIHLITQDTDGVHNKYKGKIEYFYKVGAASKSISKNKFVIRQHGTKGFFKNDKIKDISIPYRADVAAIYHSGKEEVRAANLNKFIYIFFSLLLLLGLGFYYFISTISPDIPSVPDENNTAVTDQVNSSISVIENNITSSLVPVLSPVDFKFNTLARFDCIKNECTFQKIKIPISFLEFYVNQEKPFFSDVRQVSEHYYVYTISVSDTFIQFIKKGTVQKENKRKVTQNEKIPSFNPFSR